MYNIPLGDILYQFCFYHIASIGFYIFYTIRVKEMNDKKLLYYTREFQLIVRHV